MSENPQLLFILNNKQAIVQISQHLKGILLTTLGVLILSPDALLIRLLNTDTWTAVFWRGLAFSAGIMIIMLLMYRQDIFKQFKKIGKPGIIIGVIFGLSSLCFTASIQNTDISNTLVLISTSPVFSSLFTWYFLKEKVHARTMVAMVIIFAAIALIMSNSYSTDGFLGDLAAIGSAVFMATSFTLTRMHKEVNMVPAMAISGVISAFIASLVISQTSGSFYLDQEVIPYLILGGIIISTAFALITLGPRYISSPEVSLIMPLEIVSGSYLGWIFLAEKPSSTTIIGGIVVIATLSIHAWISLRSAR